MAQGEYAQLGRGLLFDDEIATRQRIRTDAHPTQFRKQGRFQGSGAILGKRRSEPSRVGEKDRADARAGYEPKESSLEERKGSAEPDGHGG